MEREAKGIRYQSEHFPKVQGIMHRVNADSLMAEHRKQIRKKAKGIDGVDKTQYDQNAAENIQNLLERMKKFQYKPLPVRRVYIPKANGKLRPLGIPAYEDRLVQGVMAEALNDVYEPRFMDCSYGFRPGRSAHDAVRYINSIVMGRKVNYVLEADIKGFFDNVNHDWLMKFLSNDIQDKVFLRYVKRFLIAGVMEGTERMESDKGTPQGGLISPILANVYLHYVLDWWFEQSVRPWLKGEAYYVRYADDFLILFQYEEEAREVLRHLRGRLGNFGLEVAEEKTRILPIGRFAGGKESFDFLGFTFFNAKTRYGKYCLGIHTSKKKLKAKRQAVRQWLRTRLTEPVDATMKLIEAGIRGHCNYYGISGNYDAIHGFSDYVKYMTFKMLNRRSQRRGMKRRKFERMWAYYVKPVRITHDIWHSAPMTV